MSEDNLENLPSINEVLNEEDLPSVDEYMIKEETEEVIKEDDVEIIEDAEGQPKIEVTNIIKAPEWEEVFRMINDVRESIPDIPEIKSYDEELLKLSSFIEEVRKSIPDLPEVKNYDREVEVICEQIDLVKEKVSQLPEVKNYDEEVNLLESRVDILREKVVTLPEIKNYDQEIEAICEQIDSVKSQIPNLPDWVNEDTLPDLSWVGRTFSVLDEDITKVNDSLHTVKDRIKCEVEQITETISTKEFETGVEISGLKENLKSSTEEIKEDLSTTTDKIFKELKEAALKINGHHKEFKDDDRKLKKQILGEYNLLKQNINEKVEEFNDKNIESQNIITDSLREYFNQLKEEIANLPEAPKYDDDIVDLKKTIFKLRDKSEDYNLNIAELYQIVEEIKGQQQTLTEVYNDRPIGPDPEEKQGQDPLTPTDQKFATLQDLAANYRLFVNRVEQQLYTVGGGGAGFIKDMADVNITGLANNYVLKWNASTNMWDVGAAGGAGLWESGSAGIHTTSNVGVATTARSAFGLYVQGDVKATGFLSATDGHFSNKINTDFLSGIAGTFSGNLNVGGTITYQDVTHQDVLGISTFQQGIQILNNGISVNTGIVTVVPPSGIGTVTIGAGDTTLVVDGDARIIGILTIGRSSVTIDGTTNKITVGDDDVTITNSSVTIGDNVTINAGASGINSAPNVFYVAKDGDDANNGTSIDNAKLTIGGAVGVATSGSTIKVLSGNYQETNPIEVPANVSIVGDDQRSVNVSGSSAHKDIFSVRKGVKLANMTFTGHTGSAAAVGFPTSEIAENVGGGKWKGPYIQNCTSNTTTGVGIRIDGNQARLLKTMNVDAFTQYNQGGVGVAVTNQGYAQLVSVFTICCDEAITCHTGGQADVANSNCSFGTFGLVSDGKSPLQYTGFVTSSAAAAQDNVIINIGVTTSTITGVAYTHTTGEATVTTSGAHPFQVGMGVSLADIGFSCAYGAKNYPEKQPFVFRVASLPSATSFTVNLGISTLAHTYVGSGSSAGTAKIDVDRPYDGQVCYFDELYESVESITVTNGGSGYTSTPTVTLEAPSGPSGETATAFATLDGDVISSITIISSGSQYTETPDVTISGGGGSSGAATAVMAPIYYTINSSTPVTSGITTLTLAENLLNTVGVGSTVFFYQQSKIVASSHTFEYIGSGNQIASATPKRGGVTIQANEVLTSNGGIVVYTSTDQSGNFRIGDDFQIDQTTGTISGRSFSKSLFSEVTPFILALS